MNWLKHLENRIRGWLPEEVNVPSPKQMTTRTSLSKKLKPVVIVGVLAAVAVGMFLLLIVVGWMLNPIVPTDVKIIDTLNENKDSLLNITGVVGAGIARNNSDNHIIGIAVYIEDNATSVQDIPQKIGDFTVFIKRISEVGELGTERMIIRRQGL